MVDFLGRKGSIIVILVFTSIGFFFLRILYISMSCACKDIDPQEAGVPFFVQYSTGNQKICQQSCVQNLNVLPFGPIIPTRPLFPSALPPEYTSFPTSIDTNFLTVRKQACMCDLRVGCMTVDAGDQAQTQINFKNLPAVSSASGSYQTLVVDNSGRLFKS